MAVTLEDAIKEQLNDPRIERDWNELATELARLGGTGMCDMPQGTSFEYVQAIYRVVESGYAEFVRGSHVRRVKVDAAAMKPGYKEPAKKQDATKQMGFDFGD